MSLSNGTLKPIGLVIEKMLKFDLKYVFPKKLPKIPIVDKIYQDKLNGIKKNHIRPKIESSLGNYPLIQILMPYQSNDISRFQKKTRLT